MPLSTVRKLARRLMDRPARDHWRADFGYPALRAQIEGAAEGHEILRLQGVDTVAEGPGAIVSRLCTYLGARHSPRFFIDPSQVPAVCEELLACDPAWEEGLRERARALMERGLPVYSQVARGAADGRRWWAYSGGPGADELYAVRPHRFGMLPTLAMASARGLVSEQFLHDLFSTWVGLAEGGEHDGPYRSNLVVLQRVFALDWALCLLFSRSPAAAGSRLGELLAHILAVDVRYLVPRLGHSVANNHLLVDRFGQWYLEVLHPELVPRGFCLRSSADAFEAELLRQTYEDGGSFEHSTHYHELGCDLAVAYIVLSRRNGLAVSPELLSRAQRMLEFQCAVHEALGHPHHMGDATEDPVFALGACEGFSPGAMTRFRRFVSRAQPSRSERLCEAGFERAVWMLSGTAPHAAAGEASESVPAHRSRFPASGIVIMDDRTLDAAVVFRTGPAPGEAVFGGHMHADLLSIVMRAGPWSVLRDAGTYSYRMEATHPASGERWRQYLAGPQAHCGPVLRDIDPFGEMQVAFRPRALRARVASESIGEEGNLAWTVAELTDAGEYSGWRRTVVHVAGAYWIVIDDRRSMREHAGAGAHLQFGNDVDVVVSGSVLDVSAGNADPVARLLFCGGVNPELVKGQCSPLAGWTSSSYGELSPAWQCRASFDANAVVTAFVVTSRSRRSPHAPPRHVDVRAFEDGVQVVVTSAAAEDVLVLPSDPVAGFDRDGVKIRGAGAWLRRVARRPVELRGAYLSRVRLAGVEEEEADAASGGLRRCW